MTEAEAALILMVDDNLQNLQLLGNTLKGGGFRVAAARSGAQALTFVKKKVPALILLDIMMPDMDGYEVCRQLKSDLDTQKIPVIFLTARTDVDSILKGFEVGGVDYITKPFVREVVFSRINVHIRLNRALERLEAMSITDEMTGVYNRRYAFQVVDRQIALAEREKTGFVICYIDIDRLKEINDTYGHAEGDRLITTVTKVLGETIRKTDYLFRMGGDEFMVLFPNAQRNDTNMLIERLRQSLNSQTMHGVPIDFSYGFSEFRCGGGKSVQDLIQLADDRMYRFKLDKKQREGQGPKLS